MLYDWKLGITQFFATILTPSVWVSIVCTSLHVYKFRSPISTFIWPLAFVRPPPWASSYICCVDQFVGPQKIGSHVKKLNYITHFRIIVQSNTEPWFFHGMFWKCRGVRVSGHMWLPVKTFMRHGVAFGRQAAQNVVQKTGRNSELDSKMPGFCSDGRPCQESNPSNHCRNSCWTSTRLGPCSGIPHIPLSSHVAVAFQGLATFNIFVDQRYHMNANTAKFRPCHEAMCFWRWYFSKSKATRQL